MPGFGSNPPPECRPRAETTEVRGCRLPGCGLWTVFAVAPIGVHAAGLVLSVARHGSFPFAKLDLFVELLVLSYCGFAILAARLPAYRSRFLALVYSSLLGVGLLELLAAFTGVGARPGAVPWPPGMKRTSTVSDTMPGIGGDVTFSVNRYGVRGPDAGFSEAVHRILCVGGSTTECLYVSDEQSWPWKLGDELSQRTGKPIHVGNAGRSGCFSLHYEYLLEHYAHIDLAVMLPKDTSVFYDDCHFNTSGCRKIASIVADFLAPRLDP